MSCLLSYDFHPIVFSIKLLSRLWMRCMPSSAFSVCIASEAVFLACEELSGFVNGAQLLVDGGMFVNLQ